MKDEGQVRRTAFGHLLFRDHGAVAVRVDLLAEHIRHRFSEFGSAGQHELAELDDVGIRCDAPPDAVGLRYRAHIPKP